MVSSYQKNTTSSKCILMNICKMILYMVLVLFLKEVKVRFPDGLPLLDPIEDMGIKDDGLKSVIRVSGIMFLVSNKYCRSKLSSDLQLVFYENLYFAQCISSQSASKNLYDLTYCSSL